MFSNVLNPQTSSSLLARRQATLDKLKTINDAIVAEEEERKKERQRERAATSPHPTKSPGFTLFPPTPSRHGQASVTPRKLSPLMRSNTSPANLPSPSRQNFNHDMPHRAKKTVTIVSPRTQEHLERPGTATSRGRSPSYLPDHGFHFGPDVSGLILDSPRSTGPGDYDEEEEKIGDRVTAMLLKPVIPEPQWQMVSPPASSASSVTTRRSPSSSASSVQTAVTRPSVDLADEAESALRTAVEISIARQISLSKQQHNLLRPLQTSIGQSRPAQQKPRSQDDKMSPVDSIRKASLGRNERFVETKMATPILVNPTLAPESRLAQHRRSERVVLEGL
jgi:hypothetical protein